MPVCAWSGPPGPGRRRGRPCGLRWSACAGHRPSSCAATALWAPAPARRHGSPGPREDGPWPSTRWRGRSPGPGRSARPPVAAHRSLGSDLQHDPHRPFTQLGRVLLRPGPPTTCCHAHPDFQGMSLSGSQADSVQAGDGCGLSEPILSPYDGRLPAAATPGGALATAAKHKTAPGSRVADTPEARRAANLLGPERPARRRRSPAADCEAHCLARGWEVAEVFCDKDASAYGRKPRHTYERMLVAVDRAASMRCRTTTRPSATTGRCRRPTPGSARRSPT